MKKISSWLLPKVMLSALLLSSVQTFALDIYVSTLGKDKNKGTKQKPVATLEKAKSIAKLKAGKETITIHVADGIYYLPQTLQFAADESGAKGKEIVYKAEHEGKAIISGGAELKLSWKEYKNGIYQAKTPAGLAIDQLFIEGKNQRMARYPNYNADKPTDPYNGYAADAISKEKAAEWKNPKGAYIHAMHRAQWGGYHYVVTGKNDQGELTYEGGWQNNRQMGMHQKYRMVENVFEELDTEGEWYHNASTCLLYTSPSPRDS